MTNLISAIVGITVVAFINLQSSDAFLVSHIGSNSLRITKNSLSSSVAVKAVIEEGSDNDTTLTNSMIPPVPITDPSHPLIQRTNEIIYTKSGFYSPYDESIYSKEFVFRGPYIGPLNKKDYLRTMDTFGIYKAIPDISPNAYGFSIDPINPNKVWFMCRNTGTFTGEPGLG